MGLGVRVKGGGGWKVGWGDGGGGVWGEVRALTPNLRH
jgi:hypothetical protein